MQSGNLEKRERSLASAKLVFRLFGVVWLSMKVHMVDAMASGGDEGRANLR